MQAPDFLQAEEQDSYDQTIAIVGMDGVFPDAGNVAEFWENVRTGVESGTSFDRAALERAGLARELIEAPNLVTRRPMLKQVDQFDARFFDFSDIEAEALDPQLRLLLQCGYHALEEAGSADAGARLRVGSFVGVRHSRYLDEHLMPSARHGAALGTDYLQMINRKDSAATLMAYKLGLGGPAVSVNTACSTSLLAVHLACNSLLSYECDLALAGGAAIPSFGPDGNLYVPGGFLSKDGRCRPFSDDAGGTIDGAGVAMVALKRYADALRDGNVIHALILGSAINNDGDDKVGYTAPSVSGQMRVISDALAVAGVPADSIGYVEAHGTGTRLGDPIEFRALTQAYRQYTARSGYCALGSLKANIGHLGTAAGIAGLIKTALVVREACIPALVNFARPNPEIALDRSPFFVPRETGAWPASQTPRRGAVSSFGIGGTNVHMIVQQPPARAPLSGRPAGTRRLCVLSAKSPAALRATAQAIATHVAGLPAARFDDLASTLSRQRAHLPWRTSVVVDSAQALAAQWQSLAAPHRAGNAPRVAFLFPGQGSQHRGMTLALRRWPVFADTFDQVAALFKVHAGLDLPALLDAPDEAVLTATEAAQPALFATSYALCALWRALGVAPGALLGHSIGELAAACVAGVFSLEDGVKLVSARGRLMQQAPNGAMLAVFLPEHELTPWLTTGVELAAINGPAACVVSGSNAHIDGLQANLIARGVEVRRLRTSHGFHSASMDGAARQFADVVRTVTLAAPAFPVVSNVSGEPLSDAEAQSPEYWARQLRAPVQFARGLQCLAQLGVDCLLEVGAGSSLTSLARVELPSMPAIASQPHILRAQQQGDAAQTAFLQAAGELWSHGVVLDLAACQAPPAGFASVSLPGYQFEQQRHWVEAGRRQPQPDPSSQDGGTVLRPWCAAAPHGPLRIDVRDVPCELKEALAAGGHTLAANGEAELTLVHADDPVGAALLWAGRPGVRVVADFRCPRNRQALTDLLRASSIGTTAVLLEGRAFAFSAAPVTGAGIENIETNQESPEMAGESEQSVVAADAAGAGDVRGTVHAIWTQVLAREQIGMDDNFFDLGGNSLWALQIVSRVNQAFGCDIELSQLLGAATINELAALVEQKLFSQIDDSELRQLLSECGDLSDEELQLLLQT